MIVYLISKASLNCDDMSVHCIAVQFFARSFSTFSSRVSLLCFVFTFLGSYCMRSCKHFADGGISSLGFTPHTITNLNPETGPDNITVPDTLPSCVPPFGTSTADSCWPYGSTCRFNYHLFNDEFIGPDYTVPNEMEGVSKTASVA
jgi:hypothetical protein